MGIYSSGRPRKVRVSDGLGGIPHSPGEYRHRDAAGNITYIGEASDLNRRSRQHLHSGKLQPGYSVEYKVADGRYSTENRREHERQKIMQHDPPLNKRAGGGGRISRRKRI